MAFKSASGVRVTRGLAMRLFTGLALSFPALPSHAADLAETPAAEYSVCSLGLQFEPGVPAAKDLPFKHVWYGHFTGGRPFEEKGSPGRTLIDWVDQRVCFPSKPSCDAWISQQRGAFHHPEGFWTCLPLR